MKSIHILMIGAGRMAEAIISGLVDQKNENIKITVTNKSDTQRLQEVANRHEIATVNDWRDAVSGADVIISAVPPSAHEQLLSELSPLINKQLFITVAAGIDTTFMQGHLPEGAAVCWIMPNTAAQLQASMSTYVCGHYVTSEQREIIEMILASIGHYEELTEDQVHDLTAITGSAPAFLYSFVEALEEAAIQYGVSKDQARKLVVNMISGSAAMLADGNSASELREQVTTPGGSTAEGLNVLEEGDFNKLLNEAVKATNLHARGRSN
ncbi:pyrroline-5-carboxylate reductase [Anaerobacillus arseniciselenatis]|uniref:Pyrroline-5-carboxylate reductase n=1 Tax=Anaerobacillus arseniciselenatis TaxID=85682 RepID=A0A1S2LU64_9BACI|nr:pyrroline-5-carboxylate reductase [Anaerobacillus arseniciselenatis]OIJ15693.1 pyrroline-5-carboxylate reductase [Anaerobacillus arseniciselenatis]